MDSQLIRSQLPALVGNHVPSNARRFKYVTYDGVPKRSSLGFYVDPKPFTGTVISTTDEAVIVKTGRIEFAVLDRTLITADPQVGAKVEVAPYARRRFDGMRADTPEVKTELDSHGRPYTCTSHVLGAAPAKLPIPAPRCAELKALIEQLEELPAPDGYRRITHMLVDANAHDFSWLDPATKDIITTPPTIEFSVKTARFSGRVAISYMRGPDLYAINLLQGDAIVKQVEDIYFDMLGSTLHSLIDDESWLKIQVNILSGKSSPRH